MTTNYVTYKSKNIFLFHHSYDSPDATKPLTFNAAAHSHYEFMLVISGMVYHKINGETYLIKPGEIVLINIHELHSLEIDASQGYERIVFLFPDKIIPKFNDIDLLKPFHTAHNFRHIIPKEYVSKSKIRKYLDECSESCNKKSDFLDVTVASYLIQILLELLKITDEMQKNDYTSKIKAVSVNKLSQECSKYINSNLDKNLSIEEISRYLHVSHSHLYHVFKREMGITIHDFILNQKMQNAILYLNEGLSPQEISTRLGYAYYSSFYLNFKRFFGYSPSKHKLRTGTPSN